MKFRDFMFSAAYGKLFFKSFEFIQCCLFN